MAARHRRIDIGMWPFAVAAGLVGHLPLDVSAADGMQAAYVEKLKPLLATRCFSCHGGLKQEAGLRLDTAVLMGKGGESGRAIVPGDASASLILARVRDPDPVTRMPPDGDGEPLSTDEIALLEGWIKEGAPAPPDEKPEADPRDHWAFQPRTRPPVPAVKNSAWVRNPIDAFLAQAHERAGIAPQPEASRHVLVRRLFIDLIGLPPQPEELAAVEGDTSPDWYEKLVDKLLADPRHGERWARHWMDVWRYADWWGLGDQHRNSQKHMWHFRDWIVESLNADVPYDEMVRQMLAADELYPEDQGKLRATGFLARNWFLFNRTPWLDDTVEHVGKGLLGLTLNCSKCHAHKYDPIQQEDYYRFRAFFEPLETRVDMVAGEADLEKDGIPRVFDAHLDRLTHLFVRGEDTKADQSRVMRPGVPKVLAFAEPAIVPVALPKAAHQPERQPWVLEAHRATAARAVAAAEAAVARAAGKKTAATAVVTRLRRSAVPTSEITSVADAPRAAGVTLQEPAAIVAAMSADAKLVTLEAAVAAEQAAGGELAKAEAALRVERAMAHAVQRRAEAMRAAWEAEAAGTRDRNARLHAAAEAAVRSERDLVVEQARQKLLDVQGRLTAAAPDDREKIEKELVAARAAVEKAMTIAGQEGKNFTPLAGSRWTATRFRNSGKDDPVVTFPHTSSGRRTALARWITDPRNPLSARVAANQIWMRHLGTPLVTTVFEFGRKGHMPVHPGLLDWLASELVEGPRSPGAAGGAGGWSMKHLHRLICCSAAYRMGSSLQAAEAAVTADPDNRLLWRRSPTRLEAQVIRDAILSLAGTLDPAMGGPSVPPAAQGSSRRRSLYFWHSGISSNPFLATFDDAAARECYQRDQSIVPQQALALANAALVHEAATQIAARIATQSSSEMPPPQGDAAFIDRSFTTILDRRPTVEEQAACTAALTKWRATSVSPPGAIDAARAHLVWALLNHNDFVTLR